MDEDKCYPIPETPLFDRLRLGHLVRTGHKLRGFMLPVVDGIGGGIVRECCGEAIADS